MQKRASGLFERGGLSETRDRPLHAACGMWKKNSDISDRTRSDTTLLIRMVRAIQRIFRALTLRRRFRNVARLNLRRFRERADQADREHAANRNGLHTAFPGQGGDRNLLTWDNPYCYDELR